VDVQDDALDELIHRADLDGLVRMIDDRCDDRDWDGLLRVRDRARHAVATGRQLWPAATLAEYRLALLATLPTLLGAGGMVALMALFRVSFNPLDVMALPLVLGIAVDDGVHIVHRFLAEGGDVSATLRGTGRSVVLTSLTSLAAFGVLAFARHRGLASFGAAAGLGVAASLVLSVLVLPQALRAWAIRRSRSSR